MRKISLDNGKIFVINRKTGRWGISEKSDKEGLEAKLDSPLPAKKYAGSELFVLNSSTNCNLDCIYCSETEHRNVAPSIPMEIAKITIDRALKQSNSPGIVFHGSEPTMNFRWIKEVVKYGRERTKETGKPIQFSIQSNLAYLPNGFIDFIRDNGVGVSTSLDGPPEIHNKTRPFIGNRPSFNAVIENMRDVIAVQGSLNVATVVTKYNVDTLDEMVEFLEEMGVTSWQTIPAEGSIPYAPNSLDLGKQYVSIFEKTFERLREGKQKLKIRMMSQYLSSMFIHNGIDACRTCSSADVHPLMAVDYDGEVYICDYFWGDKESSCGNIQDEVDFINSSSNLRMRDIRDTDCLDCDWIYNCGGGCLASHLQMPGRKTQYCKTHLQVYEYLAKKMPDLIEKHLIKPVLEWSVK